MIRALLVACLLAPPAAWASLALAIDGPASGAAAVLLALLPAGGAALLLACVRPLRRGVAIWLAGLAIVLAWWLSLEPRQDRTWAPDVARLASAEMEGDTLVMRNVRDFEYRSERDFTPHWRERRLDLSRIEGLDLFLSYWGSRAIAHTILSWQLSDGSHLAISIETRREAGESYSALRGFFRQFELYYVVAEERDLIGLRARHRNETVYLYRLPATPEQARTLLLVYAARINALARGPAWYNAITHSCTTSIRLNALDGGAELPLDWRILLNGYLDAYLYDQGRLATELAFPVLRARSDVTQAARAAASSGDASRREVSRRDFSRRMREALPARPARPPHVMGAPPSDPHRAFTQATATISLEAAPLRVTAPGAVTADRAVDRAARVRSEPAPWRQRISRWVSSSGGRGRSTRRRSISLRCSMSYSSCSSSSS
jgi:hypothetical protein